MIRGPGMGKGGVTTATANFMVGANSNNNSDGNSVASLDMSGLANFSFTSTTGSFAVGGLITRPAALAKMANTSNTITAANIYVGNSAGGADNNNNLGVANIMDLGAGTNVLRANNIGIGVDKASGVIQFIGGGGPPPTTTEAGGPGP